MQIIRNDPSSAARADSPLFRGEVMSRTLVDKAASEQIRVGLVEFSAGGRNVMHTHTFDQVLVITEGEGIVATPGGELRVRAGDVAVIPAGEPHWHGATEGTAMSHLAIGQHGSTAIVEG